MTFEPPDDSAHAFQPAYFGDEAAAYNFPFTENNSHAQQIWAGHALAHKAANHPSTTSLATVIDPYNNGSPSCHGGMPCSGQLASPLTPLPSSSPNVHTAMGTTASAATAINSATAATDAQATHLAGEPAPSTTVPMNTGNALPSQSSGDAATQTHPEWGIMRAHDFHPLTLKHQRDLENHFQSGKSISDFYFWQANLGGYCMADMTQSIVMSSEGVFTLVRRVVEGAPHPGRRKKKSGMG